VPRFHCGTHAENQRARASDRSALRRLRGHSRRHQRTRVVVRTPCSSCQSGTHVFISA
jgi:hypothetical protein